VCLGDIGVITGVGMSGSRRISESVGGTETASGDDEHLMNNWSLTFTEYADQTAIHVQDSELSTLDRRENGGVLVNGAVNGAAPDGRGKHVVGGGCVGKLGRKTNTIEVGQVNGLPQDDKSTTIPDDSATDTFTLKDSVENESRKSPSKSNETIETADKSAKTNSHDVTKYSVLPSIPQKAQTSENVKSKPAKPEMSMAMSVGAQSGNKAPRNTPATVTEVKEVRAGPGKIQQIYVRFPGQRTGQMVL